MFFEPASLANWVYFRERTQGNSRKRQGIEGRVAYRYRRAQAVSTGYDRALVTIVDANLTTLITAYFLFQIGSGPVRGFGIVLAVGIVASMGFLLVVGMSRPGGLAYYLTVSEFIAAPWSISNAFASCAPSAVGAIDSSSTTERSSS